MKFLVWLSSAFLSLSVTAAIMADYGFSSLIGNWHPTHQSAAAYGVISVASSALAILAKLEKPKE